MKERISFRTFGKLMVIHGLVGFAFCAGFGILTILYGLIRHPTAPPERFIPAALTAFEVWTLLFLIGYPIYVAYQVICLLLTGDTFQITIKFFSGLYRHEKPGLIKHLVFTLLVVATYFVGLYLAAQLAGEKLSFTEFMNLPATMKGKLRVIRKVEGQVLHSHIE